ncbi:circadian clock-controlled protein daywake-like [Anticarsia gemmatalis]|uniref:circadian clock-controlled protein daywake-like n=1 Tax=Anticarsia gemmatalis TaxID=129554 RepID=UPI003F76A4F2
MSFVLVLLFCAFNSALSSPAISLFQCKPSDDACVTKAVQLAYPLILEPNADIGAVEMDPMHHDIIEGNLSILKFKLFNTTLTGFRAAKIKSAKYDEAADTLKIELHSPGFHLEGLYDINGRLIILPVEGNGDYYIDALDYILIINLELKTITKGGKTYKIVKSFTFTAEPTKSVVFDFRNLFNGQKELGDPVLKFANENWKEVANEVQEPVFTANCKTLITNANKYLKTLPIDEYKQQ